MSDEERRMTRAQVLIANLAEFILEEGPVPALGLLTSALTVAQWREATPQGRALLRRLENLLDRVKLAFIRRHAGEGDL